MNASLEISNSLKSASELIKGRGFQPLRKDIELVCQQLNNSYFGIALLAPFNFGKSTLINSLLGMEIMPTKIVRTTGAAVKVKFGETLKIIVTFNSGEVFTSTDAEILKEFAVLNRKGERREDVLSIEVHHPHRLLRDGVELFDLPGTNDSEAQNELVRNQVLQVDLVVQLLDAKQPFTMLEQETLREWLIDRGIESVIFVLNKVNQLDSKADKKEVYDDVLSTVDLFKSDYLNDSRKLYRVDALPAIRAKQHGKALAAVSSGIIRFEASLLTIIALERKNVSKSRLPRAIAIATQIFSILKDKKHEIEVEITREEKIRENTIRKGKQRETYFRKEFKKKIENYRDWLKPTALLASYQTSAAQALESNRFSEWRDNEFLPSSLSYTKRIEKVLAKSGNEFDKRFPGRIDVPSLNSPYVPMPTKKDRNTRQRFGDFFNGGRNRQKLDDEYEKEKWQAYKRAASSFLSDFSKSALSNVRQYEKTSISLITFPIPKEKSELIKNKHLLEEFNTSLDAMKKIQSMKTEYDTSNANVLMKLKATALFCKYYTLSFLKVKWGSYFNNKRVNLPVRPTKARL